MTIQVLFLCPHSAGKSVLAATYFTAAAARIGLSATADVAGPEPDDDLGPNVRNALHDQGFVEGWRPKLLGPQDVAHADLVVNIGCDRSAVVTDNPVIEWDVPLIDDDFQGAMTAIHELAESLARDLERAHGCANDGPPSTSKAMSST